MTRQLFNLIICFSLVSMFWLAGPVIGQDTAEAEPDAPAAQEQESENQAENQGAEAPTEQEDADQQESEPQESENSNEGQADLDAAFELKLSASSTRDLDKVCDLCESAIEKGLSPEAEAEARSLLVATRIDYAEQLAQRILPPNRDRRWRMFRREAISRLNKAVEVDPNSLEAHMLIGKLSILPGADVEAGRASVMKAVELSGDDTERLAEALVLRGSLAEDDSARLADFNQAVKIDPTNIDAVRSRGVQYMKMKQTDKAIDDFRLWTEVEPENVDAYLLLVRALGPERQAESVEILGQAIENNPDDGRLYSIRSQMNLEMDNIDAAWSDVENALRLNEEDTDALLVRASIHLEQGDADQALDDIEKVLRIQPGLVRGILMRSIAHSHLENWDSAVEDIELLIEASPGNPQFRAQLAMIYNSADQPEKSVEIFNELVEDHPGDPGMLRGRADAHLSLGQHTKAIADYELALEASPEDDGVLNNLSWVLSTSPDVKVRDGSRALELALKACELTEYREAHILSTLASAYAETGDFEKAREWAGKAVEASDDDEQRERLAEELESFRQNKPWREDQLAELEEKRREKADESGAGNDDGGDSDDNSDDESKDDESDGGVQS